MSPQLDPAKARRTDSIGSPPQKRTLSQLAALHKASGRLADREARRRQRKQVEECATCGDPAYSRNECPKSERPCGHHCNCSWVHDCCHWYGAEFGEE